MTNSQVLKAKFNPIVKAYIIFIVGWFLFITLIGIPLLIIWLCGVGKWYSRHYYEKLECVLSEKSLRFRKGIIFQIEKTIPLENIQDLTFIEGPLLRHYNLSILKIETAGRGERQSNEMKLVGIENAHLFRDKVLEQRRTLIEKKNQHTDITILSEINQSIQRIEKILIEKSK